MIGIAGSLERPAVPCGTVERLTFKLQMLPFLPVLSTVIPTESRKFLLPPAAVRPLSEHGSKSQQAPSPINTSQLESSLQDPSPQLVFPTSPVLFTLHGPWSLWSNLCALGYSQLSHSFPEHRSRVPHHSSHKLYITHIFIIKKIYNIIYNQFDHLSREP